ncbi:MAG: septation protein A [Alphaproteobacteria bacterium]|nr:septation protein A [Alphaproteobacteria bacterium]
MDDRHVLTKPQQGQARRVSHWLKFGIEIGPLILFFFANARPQFFAPLAVHILPAPVLAGPNAALLTATLVLMVAVVTALAISFIVIRRLPTVPLFTALLVLMFGGLTLYLQDSTFIKMKPTVLYAGFGLALTGGLAMGKPILPILFDQAMSLTEQGWRRLTWRWSGFFFALAILNEIVWRTQSNDVWVAFKFPGMLILIFLFSMAQMPFILRHSLPEDEAGKEPELY